MLAAARKSYNLLKNSAKSLASPLLMLVSSTANFIISKLSRSTASSSSSPALYTLDTTSKSKVEICDALCRTIAFNSFPQLREEKFSLHSERATSLFAHYQLSYQAPNFSFHQKQKQTLEESRNTAEALLELMLRIFRAVELKSMDRYIYLKELYSFVLGPHCFSCKQDLGEEEQFILSQIQAKGRELVATLNSMEEEKAETLSAEMSATLIQQAFRRHLYLKSGNKQPEHKIEWLEENLPANYQQQGLSLEPPLPEKSSKLDPQKAEQWIKAHPSESQALAAKLIQSITHRSFKKFEKGLQQGVYSFNKRIMSLPEAKRGYILVLPFERTNRSNTWVSSLALKYLAKMPEAILHSSEVKAYFKDEKSKSVHQALLMDDALYSGKQFSNEVLHPLIGQLPKNITIDVVIPFISCYGINRIAKRPGIYIHRHEKILNLELMKCFGLFKQEELDYINRYQHEKFSPAQKVLFYFDHKIPDYYSTLHTILSYGETIEKKRLEPFIPSCPTPYKKFSNSN